jgi:hypothetical protein
MEKHLPNRHGIPLLISPEMRESHRDEPNPNWSGTRKRKISSGAMAQVPTMSKWSGLKVV